MENGHTQSRGAAQALSVTGRLGHGSFMNGVYELQDEVICGKPTYRSQHVIPDGYGDASGSNLFIYYHGENDAWVISQEIQSLDVMGYAPSHIKNIWHVNNGKGPFVPDPSVKLVSAVNGQILTNLGAWTAELSGEVALKIEKEGPGSERPMSVVDIFEQTQQKFPDVRAYCYPGPDGQWKYRTYRQYFDDCKNLAKAFAKLGLKLGGTVGILGISSPQWLMANNAAIMCGGVACGLPVNVTPETLFFMLEKAEVNILLVDGEHQLEKLMAVRSRLPILEHIIVYHGPETRQRGVQIWSDIVALGHEVPDESSLGQETKRRMQTLRANRACCIGFTEGMTLQPKSCLFSHDNITWTVKAFASAIEVQPVQENIVGYLPLHQIFAQIFEIYLPMATANTLWFAKPDAMQGSVLDTLRVVRPTLFLADPFIWTKLKAVASAEVKQTEWTLKKGTEGSMRQQRGQTSSGFKFKMADRQVFSKVKKTLGLNNCRLPLSAFGPPVIETMEYFFSVNFPIYDTYGLTESCGTVMLSTPGTARQGSVGKPFAGIQVRLIPNTHEIIVFGRNVFMGYLGDPEASAAAIDERGFLHTSDIGNSDRTGFLYLTGRLPNLIVTAGGEHILPEAIEARIRAAMPFVAQALLVGDKRKFLAAFLSLKVELDAQGVPTQRLAPEAVDAFKEFGCSANTIQDVLRNQNQKIRTNIDRIVDEMNANGVSEQHRVTRWEFLPRALSPMTGELTPTLKVNRKLILAKNEDIMNRIYGNEVVNDYTEAKWFHGGISRQDTEMLRKRDGGGQDGWFLVRKSVKEKNAFVITLCYKSKLYHNQIFYKDGTYNTHKDQGNHQYESLQQLVEHHFEGANGFQCALTVACRRLR